MNPSRSKRIRYASLLGMIAFAASAQESDAKVIQFMDFLQHRDLVEKRELIGFYAAVKGTDTGSAPKAEAGRRSAAKGGSQSLQSAAGEGK